MSRSGSWSWSAQTGKLLWSREHRRILGRDPDGEEPPTIRYALRKIHPEDRAGFLRSVQSSIRGRVAFTCDCRLIGPEGVQHLHVAGRPELDASGALKGYVGTTVNMSDYKRTQEALQAAQLDLAHASRLATIGELTALIAHEVRQPLTAIASQADACRSWLAHDPPNISEAVTTAARIADDAHRASGVIESIKQITRKTTPTRVPVDMNNLVSETVKLLSGEIRRRRTAIRTDLGHDIPPAIADRVQLQQVVMNLVMNGVDAMETVDDRRRIVTLKTGMDPSRNVIVAVADVGVGLPSDKMDRLFDGFFSTKPDGLGMGLSICRSIIEAHGGSLWATPNHPYGSVFQFTLPVQQREEDVQSPR